MDGSPLESARFVVANLGVRVPALHLLKRVGYVDHFYHLTAALRHLRYPRLRSDLRFALAGDADLAEIARGLPDLDPASRKELAVRLLFHRAGFRECYVGRSHGGALVSLQWLLRPRDNPLLRRDYRWMYYPLARTQVMIENIFIFPAFRLPWVFQTVNHHVLEVARRDGFQACNAYVRKDNLPSLNAYLGLGFRLQKLLTAYNLAGLSWRTL